MSDKEHLSLYKSKSGNHLLPLSHRERIKDEKKKNRNKDRHAAYTAHRVIEKTPQKQMPGSSSAPSATTTEPGSSVATKSTSVMDRKIAFIGRLQRFRERKAIEELERKKVIPFVSAVPSGRFVSVKPAQAITKAPLVPKKIEPKDVIATPAVLKTPTSRKNQRYSPINTRSKKFTLLSPSQLPTPTRKKRKQIIARDPTTKVAKKVKKAIAPAVSTDRPATSSKAAPAKIKSVATSAVRKFIPAPTVQKTKPKTTSASTRPTIQAKKPATVTKSPASQPFKITEVPKIPSKFDFTTSTAVKPRNSVVVPVRSRQNSVQLFNESISPIENGTPKSTIKPSMPKETPTVAVITEEPNDLNTTPVNATTAMDTSVNYVSPFVTISRGKHHVSKEREARESKYKLESRKSIDLNESIEDRQNKEAACYFRLQIKSETDRLLELVDKWLAVKEADGDLIPTEFIDLIDVTIGQTRLLISNKFEQFRGLVDKCEAAVKLHPVRPEDLEGFWGMVYMQVENCNARFDRLDTLKANDWTDPDIKVTKTKKLKTNGGIVKAKGKKRRSNGMLSKMLDEARKKMKESKENDSKKMDVSQVGPSIFSMSRKRSLLVHANDSPAKAKLLGTPRKSCTPRKSLWVVSIRQISMKQ